MSKIICILFLLPFFENVLCQDNNQFYTSIITNTQDDIGKEFLFPQSKSLDKKEFNSRSLKGKITLINFWFEACEPCVAEFSALNKIYTKCRTNKKLELVSFTFESHVDALKIAKKYFIEYPVICISKDDCYKLNFNHGFPTNIITDSLGKVAYLSVGGPIDSIEVEKNLNNTILQLYH